MRTYTDQFAAGTDTEMQPRTLADERPGRRSRRWTFGFGGIAIAITAAAGLAIALTDASDEATNAGATAPRPNVTQPAVTQTTAPAPPTTVPTRVHGWPDTTENAAGVYSWDGTSDGPSSNEGFMHNGYASGDVTIRIALASDPVTTDGATAVAVAGHDALYRRTDAQREEWIADVDGMNVVINLDARPATSESDLAEAHAIIESMRTEPTSTALGFRLVFTLTTDDWDSG